MAENRNSMVRLAALYEGELFYSWQVGPSYESATVYANYLTEIYPVQSVVDFGCGRGAWLKAMHDAGANRLVGLDGPWNRQDQMIDPKIEFIGTDLNHPKSESGNPESFDLAMSLEVFEHLDPSSAERVVEYFCSLAPVLVFGGAFTHQGGQNHINERPHSYWAKLFLAQGYLVYDLFRPKFWGDERVCYYYQQNTFLYVKKGHPLNDVLLMRGVSPLVNISFMDCVHPVMLYRYASLTVFRRMRLAFSERAPKPLKYLAGLVRQVFGIAAIRGPEGRSTV